MYRPYLLILNLLLLCGLPLGVSAQTSNPLVQEQLKQTDDRMKQSRRFQLNIPKNGLPGRRESGGSRGPKSCFFGDVPILALLLPTNNVGLTTAAYPQFFWYTPKNTAPRAEFSLYKVDEPNDKGTLVYNTTFKPSSDGVTSLALSSNKTIAPLAINQTYHWFVSIICDPQDSRSVITVDGWVQRVAISNNLLSQLQGLSPRKRISVYDKQGLWFDLLSTLADLRACNPSDTSLSDTWLRLLKETDLLQAEAIAQQPLLQKCPRLELVPISPPK